MSYVHPVIREPSWRHHYIPEYFIKGFIKPETKVWLFDKSKGRIISKPQSPSSVFFEPELNNIYVDGTKSSLLENSTYRNRDQKFHSFYKKVFEAPKSEALDHEEFAGMMSWLIADLSFRTLPLQRWAAEQTFEALKKPLPERLQRIVDNINTFGYSDVDKAKLLNGIAPAILLHTTNQVKMRNDYDVSLTDFDRPVFLLSDNPIIHEQEAKDFDDLTRKFIFPLTSRRVCLGFLSNYRLFDQKAVQMYLSNEVPYSKK